MYAGTLVGSEGKQERPSSGRINTEVSTRGSQTHRETSTVKISVHEQNIPLQLSVH